MTRDHQQYEENVGAYVLGALNELESEVFERHLDGCPSCRREFEQLRMPAEALPRAVEPVVPPPELKEALMRTVLAEAAEREEAKQKRRWSRPFPLERLPQLRPGYALAAAACTLAIGIAIGVGVANIGGGGGERTVAALVDHARAPAGSASLTVPKNDGTGAILTVQGLPKPGAGKVYEVWVQRSGVMQPAGSLFSVGKGGTGTAGLPGNLKGAEAVAVTAERSGGTLKPTGMPVLTVKLS
jgi:anti-sigma-K factor RskA